MILVRAVWGGVVDRWCEYFCSSAGPGQEVCQAKVRPQAFSPPTQTHTHPPPWPTHHSTVNVTLRYLPGKPPPAPVHTPPPPTTK